MFKRSLSVTALTTDSANEFFTNIYGDSFNSDTSFVATLRALLANRIPDSEEVVLRVERSTYNADSIQTYGGKRVVEAICDKFPMNKGRFVVHNLAARSDSGNEAILKALRENLPDMYSGWHEVSKVGEFFRKSFQVACFVNEESKCAAVYVDQLNMQKWHYLQMAILAILTWYFDPSKGVSEMEMNLIQSLRSREAEEYEACLAKIAETYDFETARLKKLLNGFESRYEKIELEKVKRNINQIDRNIDDLSNQFARYNRERNEACIRLLGLQQKIADGVESNEIMDFFLSNRILRLESVSDSTMTFVVRTYLDFFDEDVAQRAIEKKTSNVYSYTAAGMGKDEIELFMRAVFLDQKLRIRFCAAYQFELNGRVYAKSGYNFDSSCNDYMPNPHIQQYSCLGNYEMQINKLLGTGDYIGAISQCMASAKSLNFGDGVVIEKFMEWITRGPRNKCVELPNGSVVKPVEAVKWLKEQQETTAEEATSERV